MSELRRAKRPSVRDPSGPADECYRTAVEEEVPENDPVCDFRARQSGIAELLGQVFGDLGTDRLERWENRALCLSVAIVYERLAVNAEELPTRELVSLAKLLAERRRTGAKPRDADPHKGPAPRDAADEAAAFATHVSRAVKEIYGINWKE